MLNSGQGSTERPVKPRYRRHCHRRGRGRPPPRRQTMRGAPRRERRDVKQHELRRRRRRRRRQRTKEQNLLCRSPAAACTDSDSDSQAGGRSGGRHENEMHYCRLFKGAPRHAGQAGRTNGSLTKYKDEHGIWRERKLSAKDASAGLGPEIELIPLLSLSLSPFWAR